MVNNFYIQPLRAWKCFWSHSILISCKRHHVRKPHYLLKTWCKNPVITSKILQTSLTFNLSFFSFNWLKKKERSPHLLNPFFHLSSLYVKGSLYLLFMIQNLGVQEVLVAPLKLSTAFRIQESTKRIFSTICNFKN